MGQLRYIEVWMKDFKHLLRIRKSNHHARCSQCLRHRLIIRKLGHFIACLPEGHKWRSSKSICRDNITIDGCIGSVVPSAAWHLHHLVLRLSLQFSTPWVLKGIHGLRPSACPPRVCLMGPTQAEFHLTADPRTRGSNGVVAALCHLQQQSFNRDHQPWIIFDFSRWI